MEHVDDYFEKSPNLSCTVGSFPEKHSEDYCWGGCPGALQEAMHIFRAFYPDIEEKIGKTRYVVGNVEGPLNLEDGERVIFAGDCCKWQGSINGDKVTIEGDYKTTSEVDVRKTKSNDMILKIVGSMWNAFKHRSSRHVHAKGCPVSVGQHVTYLSSVGKIPDVNFDKRYVVGVNIAYWQMRAKRFLSRFLG